MGRINQKGMSINNPICDAQCLHPAVTDSGMILCLWFGAVSEKNLFCNRWIDCASVNLFNPSWDPPERLVCRGNESVLECCAVQDVSNSFPTLLSPSGVFLGRGFNNSMWKLRGQPDFSWSCPHAGDGKEGEPHEKLYKKLHFFPCKH